MRKGRTKTTGFVFDEHYMWHHTGNAAGGDAGELCRERLLAVHGGGYSTLYVPFCALAVIEALSGIKTEAADPYLEFYEDLPGQQLRPHQDAVVKKCEDMISRFN